MITLGRDVRGVLSCWRETPVPQTDLHMIIVVFSPASENPTHDCFSRIDISYVKLYTRSNQFPVNVSQRERNVIVYFGTSCDSVDLTVFLSQNFDLIHTTYIQF